MDKDSGWVALIPFKPAGQRKTRLAGALSPRERDGLSDRLFSHVCSALTRASAVARIVLLSETEPPGWSGAWIADQGRGLNAELQSARQSLAAQKLLVIHADLPFVTEDDLAVLIAQAAPGCAIAPDRHGTGTNALALEHFMDFSFAFGPDSFRLHLAAAAGRARIVERPGLAFDIDTPEDLQLAPSVLKIISNWLLFEKSGAKTFAPIELGICSAGDPARKSLISPISSHSLR